MQHTSSKIQFCFMEIITRFGVISAKHSNASQADLIQRDILSAGGKHGEFQRGICRAILSARGVTAPPSPPTAVGEQSGQRLCETKPDFRSYQRINSGIKIPTLPPPAPPAHPQVSSLNSQPSCPRSLIYAPVSTAQILTLLANAPLVLPVTPKGQKSWQN